MKRIRVGVIGVGHLGQHHARLYAGLPEAVLVGVADADPDRVRLVAERHRVTAFDDPSALLERVEAVSVAVPTSAHHAVVKACLQAGVHVLVEKPIAATREEAHELVKLSRRHERIIQVGHIERFNPAIEAVRPFIKEPGFIECHRLSPFGERGTDVDVILDLMSHDLDMVLSFRPGPVEEVRAAGVPVLSPNIDIANARIVFGSGCVANLTASRVSTTRMRKLRVFQRDAYISVDYQTRQGVICRRQAGQGSPPEIEVQPVQGKEDEPLKLELAAFLHAVATGSPSPISGEDGAAVLDLAHRILEAIRAFMQRHGESG